MGESRWIASQCDSIEVTRRFYDDGILDADNTLLVSGETITGMLDKGDIDTFTIDGAANDKLSLTIQENCSGFTPGVFIFAPNGMLIGRVNQFSGIHLFAEITLPLSGRYTIVIREFETVGDFELLATIQ